MGLFAGESENKPDVTKRSARKVCWEARDEFFACLDKNNIDDAIKDSTKVTQVCPKEEAKFEADCISSWVEYFKQKRFNDIMRERQIKMLEERGAIEIKPATSFK
ncbi:cytochrome c oxidase assembly factor 6 [Trichomonascus vanleenenianus]|uniref:Coa6p n=1 Tax=Trichomonascus vanleenenianus TaxID=2268995 RepID=UPI003ECAC226